MDLNREVPTDNLMDDLDREFEAVTAYLAHAHRLKGAQAPAVADDRELQARAALQHALTLCKQTNQLEGDPLLQTAGD